MSGRRREAGPKSTGPELVRSLTHARFLEAVAEFVDPRPFQANVLKKFLFKLGATRFDEITPFPREARDRLAGRYLAELPATADRAVASDGTVKLLLDWAGVRAEAVTMKSVGGRTACLSSQSGCRLRCAFCATGRLGLTRNLAFGEILDQLLVLGGEGALDRVVMMGMGEPLENLDEVLPALEFMTSPAGLGFSRKRVTLSTVGLPPEMARLAAEGPGVELALSLHAVDNTLRTALVPVNKKYDVTEVLKAATTYADRANAKVTIEYVLLKDLNDSDTDADSLGRLSRRHGLPVNIIRYNAVAETNFEPSPRLDAFAERLKRSALAVTVRRSRGASIAAACGQLAGESKKEE